MEYLEEHDKTYSPFVETRYSEYLETQKKDGIFGDHLAIVAYCALLQSSVAIVDDNGNITLVGHGPLAKALRRFDPRQDSYVTLLRIIV